MKSCQRPLKYIVTAIVRGDKWSLLEPHSLSIALLDWTTDNNKTLGRALDPRANGAW